MIENRRGFDIFCHAVLIVGVLLVVFPVYVAFCAATMNESQVFSVPLSLVPSTHLFENIATIWTHGSGNAASPFGRMLVNSLVMALVIAIGKIAVSMISAYAIVFFRFPFKNLAFWLIFVTFLQGVGMGFVFVPMNLTAFATLPGQFRTDGTAMTNLMRNIGSAIGVSVTTAVMGGSVQIAHALLAGHASPFNRAFSQNGPSMMMNPQIPFGLANFNGLVEYRAEVIAFQNDFLFMFYASLPALLVIWLMKRPQFAPGAPKPEVEVME